MTADSTVCLPADVLRAFGLGTLPDDAVAAVARHLDNCAECRAAAALATDSFLDRLRAAHTADGTPPPPRSLAPTGTWSSPPAGTPGTVYQEEVAPLPEEVLSVAPELTGLKDYRVIRKLGQGGMGAVYLARNVLSNTDYALKVIGASFLARAGAEERFLQEIRAAVALGHHRNIVAAYPPFRHADALVHVMEYVDGHDLAEEIRTRSGPLPLAHVCSYVGQAALGLQHAHDHGMVHRDIKPHNLILTRVAGKRVVKVMDFGLAKVRTAEDNTGLTGTGLTMGTPDYMSPEQARDAANADHRSDIYSLGCTLYHLLAGAPPFAGGGQGDKLIRQLTEEPPPVRGARPDAPEELAAVLARMMAKAPAARFQTAKDVAKALAPFTRGESAPAPAGPSVPTTPQVVVPTAVLPYAIPVPPAPEPAATVPDGPGSVVGPTELLDEPAAAPPRPRRPRRNGSPLLWAAVAALVGVCAVIAGGVGLWASGLFSARPTAEPPKAELVSKTTGMKLVRVPAGKFFMGSPTFEEERDSDEDQHEVEITKPFFLGVREVTRGQFAKFVTEYPQYRTQADKDKANRTWFSPGFSQTDDHPVVCVSWDDAAAFCLWLSREDGVKYRLPTEAEWEYACRAGTQTPFSFGTALNGFEANCDGNFPYGTRERGRYVRGTTPGGKYPPNAFGLSDVHGNAWEWCQDCFGPYGDLPRKDPAQLKVVVPERRILRGGSWYTRAVTCRSAERNARPPREYDDSVGFRVAATAE